MRTAKKKEPLERDVERRIVDMIKKRGGTTRKMNGFGFRSWPDRLVILPKGIVFFIEVKRSGRPTTSAQIAMHDELAALGFDTYVVDTVAQAEWACDESAFQAKKR